MLYLILKVDDKVSIKRVNKVLLIVSLILFAFGLIMVFSSSNVTAYMRYNASPYYYFIHQAIFLGVGLLIFLLAFMLNLDSKKICKISTVLFYLTMLSLLALLVVGRAKNNAVSWFKFGKFTIQPSEFAKIFTIFYLASYYDKNKNNLGDIKTLIFPIIPCIITAVLIFLQPDLGTTIIYTLIVMVIFFAQPMKKLVRFRFILIILLTIILAGLLVLSGKISFTNDMQKSRLNIDNPCDRLLDDGNQICNGYIAMNNGGLTGKGLGNSTQKYLYLPEPYTDFIFCILVEECGAIGGLFVLVLYIILLMDIIRIGEHSVNNRGKTICYGVFFYIFLHISVNLLGIMGLIPMTGVPLPFMSYGGSFTICLIYALTGVQIVSVERSKKNDV